MGLFKMMVVCTAMFFLVNIGCAQEKNILLIIVDDLKPLINYYGEGQIVSPHIDALAKQSAAFTNAHCQQAVCAPSRISLLTGMRPDYTKVWDLKTKMRDMNPDILTLPEYFKKNGYETVGLGKVLHGARNNDPQSWTLSFIEDSDLTYAEGYPMPANFKYQGVETQRVYNEIRQEFSGDPTSDKVWLGINRALKKSKANPSTECIDVPDDAYADGAITHKAIEILNQLSAKEKPFLMALGYHKPHLPFTAPKKYWDMYERDEIELSPFQDRAWQSPEFAYHGFGELKNYSDIEENLDETGNVMREKQRQLIHGYYACVSYIDAQVGLLLDFIRESGLDKTTNIVFAGDHGWHLGDHGIWNKHSNFEQATRTPLMFAGPGVVPGILNTSPVELIDIFPTVCELSGLPKPGHLQGTSVMPILTGTNTHVKKVALSQYPRGSKMGYAVRSDRYRYIEWHQTMDAQNGIYRKDNIVAAELYDYREDPLETKNLLAEKRYSEALIALRSELQALIKGN